MISCVRVAICLRSQYKNIINQLAQVRWSSSDILYDLIQRTLIKELIPNDASPAVSSGVPCAYAGFDATSDSLHIGNLLVLVALLHWQRAGNQAILLIGDSTAEVGDPSGRKTERDAIRNDVVRKNADSIEKSVQRIFANHQILLSKQSLMEKKMLPIKILRNSCWYDSLKAIDLVSKMGRHIRVSEMLSRTSVKSRIDSGEGINFSEFSYQLFQAYDWLHLIKNYKCTFQFGGNDQRGNIVTGRQLITGLHYKNVYGALLPLVQSESGNKYGKTTGNAVHLNENRTSPFDFYQFFMRLPDVEVEKNLKMFTFLSMEGIESLSQRHLENPDSRQGQQRLAEEVTLLVHGENGLKMAQRATQAFYKSDLNSLMAMDVTELQQIIPPSLMTELPYEHGISLLGLTLKAGCFLNESDAKRIITSGGVYLNFQQTTSPTLSIAPGVHVLPNSTTLLRVGKKTYYLVIWK